MTTLTTHRIFQLADLVTPVGLLIKLREHFPEILLLESADYSSRQDSRSYLFFESLLTMTARGATCTVEGRGVLQGAYKMVGPIQDMIDACRKEFQGTEGTDISQDLAWVGYTGFDMSDVLLDHPKGTESHVSADTVAGDGPDIPGLRYDVFRYTVMIDHFRQTLEIVESKPDFVESGIDRVLTLISRQDVQPFRFCTTGEEKAHIDDNTFLSMIEKAKGHCQRGDVFQLVLSRRYSQTFQGDELEVYRKLRSVNPSPYLFYFDYGSFRIFGSSPEAQVRITAGVAEVHPIAGTIKRTGDDNRDRELALRLVNDPKENAEHVMLVDLARNDLSRHCTEVSVVRYRDVQYFSHVIHLVSRVAGKVRPGTPPYRVFADTFPAGTLSGAPKSKALALIRSMEPERRGFYGGGLGIIQWNGDLHHAIVIRSFLSQNNTLYYQAGAGIVIDSIPENEVREVHNKLAALRTAIST